jgi:hypothetical protein
LRTEAIESDNFSGEAAVDEDVLRGWDEIATYIGVEPRTAQRYEKTRDLPVTRLPGAKGPVFARKSDLDQWRLGAKAVPTLGLTTGRGGQGSGELAEQALKRIYASREELKLYRRDYVMRFNLRSFRGGIEAHIEYRYELYNATDERQPFVQEVTVDGSDNGHVERMSFSQGTKTIYDLKRPRISQRYVGWVTYRAPRQWVMPGNTYVCRASWVIHRGPNDIWYNHMILPTIGFRVETHASPEYEIIAPRPDTGLAMKGEHRDIAWHKRSEP